MITIMKECCTIHLDLFHGLCPPVMVVCEIGYKYQEKHPTDCRCVFVPVHSATIIDDRAFVQHLTPDDQETTFGDNKDVHHGQEGPEA